MNDVFETSDLVDLTKKDHPQAVHFGAIKLASGDSVGDDEKFRHDSVKPVGDINGI
ncbi:MAG: hypothetical protein AB7P23_06090 [Amphiplicatus sp.]